jgi:membrane protein
MLDLFSRIRAVLTKSLYAWIDHRAGSKGAALAFYTLFSMTPILILAIAGAGYFFGAAAAQGEIIAQVEGLVGHSGAQAIQTLLVDARDSVRGLTATMIASVLLLVGATSVFVELKGSLDELWGLEPPKGLAVIVFLRTQLHSFGLVWCWLSCCSFLSCSAQRLRCLNVTQTGYGAVPTIFSRPSHR